MSVWLVIATMAAATAAILLSPLVRKRKQTAAPGAHDLAVYRDQLTEITRDLERGTLKPDEAAAARLEIERRILAAGSEGVTQPTKAASRAARRTVIIAAILGPIAAIGIYLDLGVPSMRGYPFAERGNEPESSKAMSQAQLTKLVDRLAKKMAERPDDPKGWSLLGHSYMTLGRHDEAASAYARAAALDPKDASLPASEGEALTYASEGIVTPKARDAFEKALAIDPKEPRPRFYLGLASVQGGEPRAALAAWEALAADSPPDAPWLAELNRQIAKLKDSLAAAKDAGKPAQPTSEKPAADKPEPDKSAPEKPAN